jgi:hypothetical protein
MKMIALAILTLLLVTCVCLIDAKRSQTYDFGPEAESLVLEKSSSNDDEFGKRQITRQQNKGSDYDQFKQFPSTRYDIKGQYEYYGNDYGKKYFPYYY